jgi:hypothetical protein
MPEVTFTYEIPKKSIGGFVIDAFIAEHYAFSNQVTDIPVEEGSNIADHIVESQDVISVEAFIGNAEFAVQFETLSPDGEPLKSLSPPDKSTRIRQAYQELKKLVKDKKPLDVVLGLETFTNMVITSFSIDRDVETGANLPFAMEFKKLKIVHSDTTKINASNKKGELSGDQTSGTTNAGISGTEQPKESIAKEAWRRNVMDSLTTPAEYQEKWGVPYPQ